QSLYRTDGLVRNIIDSMADFASEKMQILHPVRKHQRFFQAWSSKVNLQNRVNSFMKNLLRDGQTVVYKKNGKLNKKLVDQLLKANKELDNKDVQKILDLKIDFRKFVIPVDYIFISPATVEK